MKRPPPAEQGRRGMRAARQPSGPLGTAESNAAAVQKAGYSRGRGRSTGPPISLLEAFPARRAGAS